MPSEIRATTSSILEKFAAVLYPFPLDMLFERLPEKGWIVEFSERDESSTKLAAPPSKGNVKVLADQSARTLGVRGIEMTETLEAFKELRDYAMQTFGLPPEVGSYYTELRYVGSVRVGDHGARSLPEILDDWWKGHPKADAFGHVLEQWIPGESIGAYGIRMASRRVDPNRPNWTELTISPLAVSGHRYYRFDLLYRNASQSLVHALAERVSDLISAAASELEQ